jgi:hypothetical protein
VRTKYAVWMGIAFLAVFATAQTAMTNDAVIKMAKAGLSDDIILGSVNGQPGQYRTTADDLIALKSAGVSDKVIGAMITKASGRGGPAPAPVAASIQDHLDLSGLWKAYNPRYPNKVTGYFTIRQTGNSISLAVALYAVPDRVWFEGEVHDDSVLVGVTYVYNPIGEKTGSVLARINIADSNHLRYGADTLIARANPSEISFFNQDHRLSFVKLPEGPFNLAGGWRLPDRLEGAWIKQDKDKITIGVGELVNFQGTYLKNPEIEGEGLVSKDKWEPTKITVINPDHIYVSTGLHMFRSSKPESGDAPCDAEDTSHVEDYYAWLRGADASAKKDYNTAKCWLSIGADWDYAPAQSMLAALIIEGKYGDQPDYSLAFNLSTKSAENGDIAGQLELAGLYREGKGVAQDSRKADFWLQKADETRAAKKWGFLTEKSYGGMSVLDLAGMALKAFDGLDKDTTDYARKFGCFAEQFGQPCK